MPNLSENKTLQVANAFFHLSDFEHYICLFLGVSIPAQEGDDWQLRCFSLVYKFDEKSTASA